MITKRFICDTCNGVIERHEDGWFEWLNERDGIVTRNHGFRICHHKSKSPLDTEEGCYRYGGNRNRADMHLNSILWPSGRLINLIDEGPFVDPESHLKHNNSDLREFAEILRRTLVPHYEEARRYVPEAMSDGMCEGWHEANFVNPRDLLSILKRYAPDVPRLNPEFSDFLSHEPGSEA